MTTTLKNNAFALNRAIENLSHCNPASAIVRDGHHSGTLFTWLGDEWCVVDLENKNLCGFVERLAVVSVEPDGDEFQADRGLNQTAIGFDMETAGGEWVIDSDDLEDLRDVYGESLEVIWQQDR